jgi:hypothetical protein
MSSGCKHHRGRSCALIAALLTLGAFSRAQAQLSTFEGQIERAVVVENGTFLEVSGWARDTRSNKPPERVEVLLDNIVSGLARGGVARPDLGPPYQNTGWEARIPVSQLGAGMHRVTARLISRWTPSAILEGRLPLSVTLDARNGARNDAPFLDGNVELLRLGNRGRTLEIAGWAADMERRTTVSRIEIRMNGRIVGVGELGLPREDVDRVFAGRGLKRTGWSANIDLTAFPAGEYSVSVRAVGFGCRSRDLSGSPGSARVPPHSTERATPNES